MGAFLTANKIAHSPAEARQAGRYLVEELAAERPRFTTSGEAVAPEGRLRSAQLERQGNRPAFEDDLRGLEKNLPERLRIARAWLDGYLAQREGGAGEAAHVAAGGRRAAAHRAQAGSRRGRARSPRWR